MDELKDLLYKRYWQADSCEEVDYAILKYPQYTYQGIAYRSLLLKSGQKVDLSRLSKSYNSWSNSLEGILNFIHNQQIEGFDYDQIIVFQAKIIGLDLKKIAQDNHSNDYEISKILKEEEIIALTVEDISPIEVLLPSEKLSENKDLTPLKSNNPDEIFSFCELKIRELKSLVKLNNDFNLENKINLYLKIKLAIINNEDYSYNLKTILKLEDQG